MNPTEWFYAKGDKHFGPISSVELKRMATAGELRPESLVWREGMAEWTMARNVRGLFEEENQPTEANGGGTAGKSPVAPPPSVNPLVTPLSPSVSSSPGHTSSASSARASKKSAIPSHLFDILLELTRSQFSASYLETTSKLFVQIGKFGLYAAMMLIVVLSIILAMRGGFSGNDWPQRGILPFFAIAIGQYLAVRFCEATERLNQTTRVKVSSKVFLDGFALFCMFLGIGALVVALVIAIPGKFYWPILAGLIFFVLFQHLAFIALNPNSINVELVSELSPREEALGLIAFLVKAFLQFAPFVFGAGSLFGSLMLLYACILPMTSSGPILAEMVGNIAISSLYVTLCYPIAIYLISLIKFLFLDVLRAILVLPEKIEDLREKEEKEAS